MGSVFCPHRSWCPAYTQTSCSSDKTDQQRPKHDSSEDDERNKAGSVSAASEAASLDTVTRQAPVPTARSAGRSRTQVRLTEAALEASVRE